jgi:hypothetical protein
VAIIKELFEGLTYINIEGDKRFRKLNEGEEIIEGDFFFESGKYDVCFVGKSKYTPLRIGGKAQHEDSGYVNVYRVLTTPKGNRRPWLLSLSGIH